MDTLDFTRRFHSLEREFCESTWYCTQISVGLLDIKVADDARLQTVYLANTSGSV